MAIKKVIVKVYDQSWTMKGSGTVVIEMIQGMGVTSNDATWTGDAYSYIIVGDDTSYPIKVKITVNRENYLSTVITTTLNYNSNGNATVSCIQTPKETIGGTTGSNKFTVIFENNTSKSMATAKLWYRSYDVESPTEDGDFYNTNWKEIDVSIFKTDVATGNTIYTFTCEYSRIQVSGAIYTLTGDLIKTKPYVTTINKLGSGKLTFTSGEKYVLWVYTRDEDYNLVKGCTGFAYTDQYNQEMAGADAIALKSTSAVSRINSFIISKDGYDNYEYELLDSDYRDDGIICKSIVLQKPTYEVYGTVYDYATKSPKTTDKVKISTSSGDYSVTVDSNGFYRWASNLKPTKISGPGVHNTDIYIYTKSNPIYDFIISDSYETPYLTNNTSILSRELIGVDKDRTVFKSNVDPWKCMTYKELDECKSNLIYSYTDKTQCPKNGDLTTISKQTVLICSGNFNIQSTESELYLWLSTRNVEDCSSAGQFIGICVGRILSKSNSKLVIDVSVSTNFDKLNTVRGSKHIYGILSISDDYDLTDGFIQGITNDVEDIGEIDENFADPTYIVYNKILLAQDGDIQNTAFKVSPILKLSSTNINFSDTGGSNSFTITSNESWIIN